LNEAEKVVPVMELVPKTEVLEQPHGSLTGYERENSNAAVYDGRRPDKNSPFISKLLV
jgi:hypothetical protein